MKLQELGARRQTQQIAQVIEEQLGKRVDFDRLDSSRAQRMLARVRGALAEHRRTPGSHRSEQHPGYLNLLMLEQGLEARLSEVDTPMAIDVDSPDTKRVLDKASRGQTLNPDEQKTVTAVAMMKKESRRSRRMVKEQSELQQAQVVLASQDMVDRLQGMLEDISEMQFKDLPALVDSIRQDMGMDQATQYQAQASQALTTLLQAVQAGKTEMEAAQGAITGETMSVPGAEPQPQIGGDMMAAAPMAAPAPAEELPPEPGSVDNAALGRGRR